MNAQLKKKNHRSPWQARWGKTYAAATVISFCIIISVLFLSLAPCPTNLPDESYLNRSLQISSSKEIIPCIHPQTDTSKELRTCLGVRDSVKSEVSWQEIYNSEKLFQTPYKNSNKAGSEKDAAPDFVRRWFLHYHRDHRHTYKEN